MRRLLLARPGDFPVVFKVGELGLTKGCPPRVDGTEGHPRGRADAHSFAFPCAGHAGVIPAGPPGPACIAQGRLPILVEAGSARPGAPRGSRKLPRLALRSPGHLPKLMPGTLCTFDP